MKAILMSIRPEWVAKILNGEKTIEIRKKFPSDFVGWVYIYCTKARPYLTRGVRGDVYPSCVSSQGIVPHHLNSRVAARFWCDKVEEITPRFTKNYKGVWYITENKNFEELCIESCLCSYQLNNYLQSKKGTAIHITKLEIFDKPKELWQFKTPTNAKRYEKDLEQAYEEDEEISARLYEGIANDDECANCVELTELSEGYYGLQKSPQSWCYVEVDL